jgi:hypothetical protein
LDIDENQSRVEKALIGWSADPCPIGDATLRPAALEEELAFDPGNKRRMLTSLVRSAHATMPSQTPACGPASVPNGRPRHANPVDARPAHATTDGNLRHHSIGMTERCRRHSLRGGRNRQNEHRNSKQFEHCAPPSTVD